MRIPREVDNPAMAGLFLPAIARIWLLRRRRLRNCGTNPERQEAIALTPCGQKNGANNPFIGHWTMTNQAFGTATLL